MFYILSLKCKTFNHKILKLKLNDFITNKYSTKV